MSIKSCDIKTAYEVYVTECRRQALRYFRRIVKGKIPAEFNYKADTIITHLQLPPTSGLREIVARYLWADSMGLLSTKHRVGRKVV
jgi:hypothetical protein